MTTDFMNFNGDSLDNYLGHEMIEINEESAKSRLVINKNHHQPMDWFMVVFIPPWLKPCVLTVLTLIQMVCLLE